MLQVITYGWGNENPSEPPESGIANYLLQNDECVISQITRHCTSSINAAEEIIEKITQCEKIDPLHVTFYDLRTSWGYTDLPIGRHELLKLVVEYAESGRLNVSVWEKVENRPDLLAPFVQYVLSEPGVN